MSDFIKRLEVERNELHEKIEKLNGFFGSETYRKLSKANGILLRKQHAVMLEYLDIIDIRLDILFWSSSPK